MSNLRKVVFTKAEIPPAEAGPAPMLQWVKIEQLVIDDGYQRPLSPHNWKNIRQIADGFRWSRFSPVLCAPVEGGLFAIIDGQHRALAAAMWGYKSVPCQIVQMPSVEQAAWETNPWVVAYTFNVINRNIDQLEVAP
ncbi:ParB N-terminal domain-containing protein [Brucella sp. TWI432]